LSCVRTFSMIFAFSLGLSAIKPSYHIPDFRANEERKKGGHAVLTHHAFAFNMEGV